MLDYIVENLSTSKEIDEAFVAVSDGFESISEYLAHRKYNSALRVVPVHALSWETGGDLRLAVEQAGISDSFVSCNGDVLTPMNLQYLLDFHRKCTSDLGTRATVALFEIDGKSAKRFGVAEMEGEYVTLFQEKPEEYNLDRALVNAGYYVFDSSILDERDLYLPAKQCKLEHTLLEELARKKGLAGCVIPLSYWIDVGTMESYISAQSIILKRSGYIPPVLEYE